MRERAKRRSGSMRAGPIESQDQHPLECRGCWLPSLASPLGFRGVRATVERPLLTHLPAPARSVESLTGLKGPGRHTADPGVSESRGRNLLRRRFLNIQSRLCRPVLECGGQPAACGRMWRSFLEIEHPRRESGWNIPNPVFRHGAGSDSRARPQCRVRPLRTWDAYPVH